MKWHVVIDAPHHVAAYRADVEADTEPEAILAASRAACTHSADVLNLPANSAIRLDAEGDCIYGRAMPLPDGAYVQIPFLSVPA